MKKGRLEAFSDAVFAIIITITVLTITAPRETSFYALVAVLPKIITYLLSFVYVGIYWNNHHHLMGLSTGINGRIMWANLHLLFWISLIPFATSWVGENYTAAVPVATYGVILLFSLMAFNLLEKSLIKFHNQNHPEQKKIPKRKKETISFIIYIVSIALCFVNTIFSIIGYVVVASLWFVPNKEWEKRLLDINREEKT